jgi:ubiquitin-protein ligase
MEKELARKKLQSELDKLMNDPDINNCFGVDYWDPDADYPDVFHWQITLLPPKGTDYEGGFYKIEAKFRDNYPKTAPLLKFVTRIYHCNVEESTGHICLKSIKDGWKSSYNMEDILNQVIILLYKQNPGDAFNGSAATLYNKDPEKKEFKEKVKKYIKEYANINDYENLGKQNIPLFEKCNCYWCEKVYKAH